MLLGHRAAQQRACTAPLLNRGGNRGSTRQQHLAVLIARFSFGGERKADRDLWDYRGTCVKDLGLENIMKIHRFSYDHRNRKTLLLVTYVPWEERCKEAELEIERLAAGLSHESSMVVAKLNCEATAEREYAQRILEAKQYPSIYIFPEGKRGFARYKGEQVDAQAILAAMNRVCDLGDASDTAPPVGDAVARRRWELQGEALKLVAVPESKREMAREVARDNAGSWRWQLFSVLVASAALLLLLRCINALLDAMGFQDRELRKTFAKALVDSWVRAWLAAQAKAAALQAAVLSTLGRLRKGRGRTGLGRS